MAARSLHLDHIIILLPHNTLQNLPPWLTDNFTITPGGRHAGGETENKLICFFDGSYIELIAFINDDPKLRKGHWWDKPFGIVDFAFTTANGARVNYDDLQQKLKETDGCEIRYDEPLAGGRTRDDGIELKWEVTFPDTTTGVQRGEIPFFCHDVTSRSLRVPFSKESTTHPSTAYGARELTIYVPQAKVGILTAAYSAVFDSPNATEEENLAMFAVERMNQIVGGTPLIGFNIQVPNEEWQIKAMEERGGVLLGDLVIGGTSTSGNSVSRIDPDGDVYGRIVLDTTPPPSNFVPYTEEPKEADAKKSVDSSKPITAKKVPAFLQGYKPAPKRGFFQPPSGNTTGRATK